MKESLKPGLQFSKTVTVDEARCIGFMGKEGMVYATPRMVSDVEYTCRDFLLQHVDPGEDSVGAHVSVEQVGRGKHIRFVVESAKTRERLAAKRAKAGL